MSREGSCISETGRLQERQTEVGSGDQLCFCHDNSEVSVRPPCRAAIQAAVSHIHSSGAEQGCIKTSLTGQIWTGQTQPDLGTHYI